MTYVCPCYTCFEIPDVHALDKCVELVTRELSSC